MQPENNNLRRTKPPRSADGNSTRLKGVALCTSLVILLTATLPWARRWLYSGCPIETLLVLYGRAVNKPGSFFELIPLSSTLPCLNLLYAVVSTSQPLYLCFSVLCWLSVASTGLLLFPFASELVARNLLSLLKLFNLVADSRTFKEWPALQFEATMMSGLLVARSLTMHLSSLRVEARGIEAGIRLAGNVELSLYTDEVVIYLFRWISIKEVYAILRSAREDQTPAETTLVDLGDQYKPRQQSIPDTDVVEQSRQRTEKEQSTHVHTQRRAKENAAVCLKLQDTPSIFYVPHRTITVANLLAYLPQWLRYILRRTPLVQRLLLSLLSYLHPISISSLSIAGTGKRLASIHEEIFGEYTQPDHEFQQLDERISFWLSDTNFCVELTDIENHVEVPLRKALDVRSYMQCADVIAYCTAPDSGAIETAMQIGGVDTMFTIPLYLLPHHEHLLPPVSNEGEWQKQKIRIDKAEGYVQKTHAQKVLTKLQNDEGEICFTVHSRLPVHMDQTLLDVLAEVCKEAARVIKMETDTEASETTAPLAAAHGDDHVSSKRDKLKAPARELRKMFKQGLKEVSLRSMVDDQWISKVIAKLAAQLERTQGAVGYSGEIPVPLHRYRRLEATSKLLA